MIGIRWTSHKNELSNPEYLSKYFKAFEYIKDYYTSRREILSEKHFGKPYNRLNKEKQEDICLINDMLIWFIFQ
jgi:hypothetical protein